jgi:hypothetical protein
MNCGCLSTAWYDGFATWVAFLSTSLGINETLLLDYRRGLLGDNDVNDSQEG